MKLDQLRSITILKQSDGRWQFLCVHDSDGVVLSAADLPDAETCMENIMQATLPPPAAITLEPERKSERAKRLATPHRKDSATRTKKRHRTAS